ncbi:hypothetical protein POPA111323_04295 [Polynucleobacter paneuropaeus]
MILEEARIAGLSIYIDTINLPAKSPQQNLPKFAKFTASVQPH